MAKKSGVSSSNSSNSTERSSPVFSRDQFLRSAKFKQFYDVISVCMSGSELISSTDLQVRIDSFLKGKVL